MATVMADPEFLPDDVQESIQLVAPTDATVLITGETGTGKSTIAHQIHELHAARKNKEFRRANIGALVPELAASQLFGHVKGAYTDATEAAEGIIVEADGGTLFLDEVSTAANNVQVMLLTLFETKTINPVGASMKTRRPKVDVRLVCASIESPVSLLASDTFRADLFYRMAEYHIALPPLRDRAETIPALAEHFLGKAHNDGLRFDMSELTALTPAAMKRLQAYHWPGNLRELDHAIRSAVIRSRCDPQASMLEEHWIDLAQYIGGRAPTFPFDSDLPWEDAKAQFNNSWAKQAIASTNGVLMKAAKKYGIAEKTLRNYRDDR